MWVDITNQFPKFSVVVAKVPERISNFIPHFTEHVIIYPCWDFNYPMLVEWALALYVHTLSDT